MSLFITYLPFLLAGTLYGFVFGLIPVAGALTGLLTVYSFIGVFGHDPYAMVVFTTALVVACSIGDLFSSIVMNIPGAAGSAATMVDGFPMSKKGQAARALSAGIFSSVGQGLIWGTLVFLFLPYYAPVVLSFGIPEMLMFLIFSMASVTFINSHHWGRGLIALGAGVFLGLVGLDPTTGAARFTGGWYYLGDGIQLIPVIAGFLAVPEIVEALYFKIKHVPPPKNNIEQIRQGMKDSWRYKWDSVRGGLIGGAIGLLPGIGGAICDWMAYGQTVALAKNDKIPFGEGNVRGVVGPEGSALAQKATSYVPTVLFGVPGAPFEVIVMSLFMMMGLEMGTVETLTDAKFFNSLSYGYMGSLLLTFGIALVFIKYASGITKIPMKYYFIPILGVIVWSSVQYTGGWEDYTMVFLCSVAGLLCKHYKFSRISLLIGFILAGRLEKNLIQYTSLYDWADVFTRPISLVIIAMTLVAIVYGIFFNKAKINYV
jgi:putative tricarboxylic transport membrane protein